MKVRWRRAALVGAIVLVTLAAWGTTIAAVLAGRQLTGALDEAADMARVGRRPQATVVFDRSDRPAFSYFVEQRIDVPIDRVSPHMIDALLAAEDRRFFSHHGLDPVRIVKAAWRDWRAGRIVEGGSTITQQLARAVSLTPERTITRKLREAAISLRLEDRYSKREILEAYLNTVYFGDGYYGVEAASRGYFHKHASDLQPAEAALLAALVRSPSAYSPTTAPRRALVRRNLVLRLMRDTGRLAPAEYGAAIASPLRASAQGAAIDASASCGAYFEEEVRRELTARFGAERVLGGGLRVYTGYDPEMQCAAERAITARIADIVARRKAARDLQGSLVAIDPASGEVRALVGGRSFEASSFDRATQARRQPGSAFKPIIYAAAVEGGLAPASILRNLDDPIMTAQGPWLPSGEHERTEYTVRAALKLSSNRSAAHVLQQIGYSTATYYAQRMGITSKLPSVASLALGTGDVSLLELTSAYGVFANRGVAVSPHLVQRVEDRDGTLIWSAEPSHVQAVSPSTAFLMSSMLADVIQSGTATAVRASGFRLPAAGKTGTTDDYDDAWFIGYTPHLVAGVWFGMDRPTKIMNRGFAAVVAVPAWAAFMKQATAHDTPDWFDVPPDVEKIAICPLSGERATEACRHGWLGPEYVRAGLSELPGVLAAGSAGSAAANAAAPGVIEDYFAVGSEPTEYCTLHGGPAIGIDGTPIAGQALTSVPGAAVSSPGAKPVAYRVERVIKADGTLHFVVRQ